MPSRPVIHAICIFALCCGSAIANPIGLDKANKYPDIFSDALSIAYTANNNPNNFLVQGIAEEMVDQSLTHHAITGAQGYSISATISTSGVASAASLSITGTIADLGANSPLLLGNLIAFGFPNGDGGPGPPGDPRDQPLEFLFMVTGGSLATPSQFGMGSTVGVIISQVQSNYSHSTPGGPIDWTQSFNNFNNVVGAVSDTYKEVPEPASLLLISLVLGPCLARRNRTH